MPNIRSKIHRIQLPTPFYRSSVNVYYIHGPDPLLVDAGMYGLDYPHALPLLKQGVEKAGGLLSHIKRVILTHGHSDHTGLAGKFFHENDADIYIHPFDNDKLISRPTWPHEAKMANLYNVMAGLGVPEISISPVIEAFSENKGASDPKPAHVFQLLPDETIFCKDLEFKILHTPGHTPGSICLFDPAGQQLISGDTLLEKITPTAFLEHIPHEENRNYKALLRFKDSLDSLKQLPITSILPGHGPIFFDPAMVIKKIEKRQHIRKTRIWEVIKKKSRDMAGEAFTPFDISCSVYAGMARSEPFITVSEVLGYLELLEMEKKVASELMDHKIFFYALP